MTQSLSIALIKGDGIGVDVSNAAMAVTELALSRAGAPAPDIQEIEAGAGYFARTGQDIEPGGEARAGAADAIFLGAIGLPAVRCADGPCQQKPAPIHGAPSGGKGYEHGPEA